MPVAITPYTLTKAVSDDRDFLIDLQTAPEIVAGATCSSATVSGGSGLTFGAPAALAAETDGIPAGEGVSVRISGGSAGTSYEFALVVALSTSRTLVVPCRLDVASDY